MGRAFAKLAGVKPAVLSSVAVPPLHSPPPRKTNAVPMVADVRHLV